jgi:hypothetical protein
MTHTASGLRPEGLAEMAIRRAVCRETNVVCHQRPDLVGLNPRLSLVAPQSELSRGRLHARLRSFVVRASRTPASGCQAGITRPCDGKFAVSGADCAGVASPERAAWHERCPTWIAAFLAVWHLGRTRSPVLKLPNFAKTGGYRNAVLQQYLMRPADEASTGISVSASLLRDPSSARRRRSGLSAP